MRVPVALSEASDPSTTLPTMFTSTSSMPPYLNAVASRETGAHCISLVNALQFYHLSFPFKEEEPLHNKISLAFRTDKSPFPMLDFVLPFNKTQKQNNRK